MVYAEAYKKPAKGLGHRAHGKVRDQIQSVFLSPSYALRFGPGHSYAAGQKPRRTPPRGKRPFMVGNYL